MAAAHAEAPAALVTHAVVVGVDPEAAPTGEEGAPSPAHLSADVLHAFPLPELGTPAGPVPPLPDSVALFCLPAGVKVKARGDAGTGGVRFFSFVLTNMDGSRSFGTCVSWYEPLRGFEGEPRGQRAASRPARHSAPCPTLHRHLCAQGPVPHVFCAVLHAVPRSAGVR